MATSSETLPKKSKKKIRLDMYGSDEEKSAIFDQLHQIKQRSSGGAAGNLRTTTEVLLEVFGFWLHQHEGKQKSRVLTTVDYSQQSSSFALLNHEQSKSEAIHLISTKSLKELEGVFNIHGAQCPGYLSIGMSDMVGSGFWYRSTISCSATKCGLYVQGKYRWSMSSYVSPNDTFINQRILHATQVAGILPSQLDVFIDAANIKSAATKFLRPSAPSCERYIKAIHQVGSTIHCLEKRILYNINNITNNII